MAIGGSYDAAVLGRVRCALWIPLLLVAASAQAQPVIPPGQESRVLELLEPRGFASEPVDGWSLADVTIQRSFIELTIGNGDRRSTLRLHPPDAFSGDERTPSFSVERRGDSPTALDPWVAAIRRNDDGEFWGAMPAFRLDRHSESAGSPMARSGERALDPTAVTATVGAFALVLLVAFGERRRYGADDLPAAPESRASLRTRWRFALALSLASAVALWLTASAPPLHPDTNRDLLLARDCLESSVCLGPSTSFGGLDQHGGWTRLLALLRGIGLAPAQAHQVLIGLNAVGAGLLAFVAARRLPLLVALPSSAVAFTWLMWGASFPILWNPTLTPLAYALLFAGALERRWAVAAVMGGLGAVLAVETHVAGLVALGVLVLALRALADRPVRAVLLALLIFGSLELALSAPAIAKNLSAPLARRVVLPSLVVGLGMAWLVGGVVRRRTRPSRRAIVVLALSAAGTTGPPLLAALAAGHFLTARYFVAAIVPLVALGAVALAALLASRRRAVRWIAPAVAVAAVALSVPRWKDAADRQFYDLAEVAVLADALDVAEGYPRVRLGLRGPMTGLLGEGLAAWAPDATFEPPSDAPTRRVVRVEDSSDLPEGWRAVALPSGAVAGIGELASWLRPERAEVCLSGESGPPECVTLTLAMWRSFGGERSSYERLSSGILPAAEALRDRVSDDGSHSPTLFVRIPVVTDESDAERRLQLFDDVGGDGGWRVARVEGVAHRGELGGQRVVLVGGGSEGTLTLEHTGSVNHFVPSLILDALELSPGERALGDVVCASFQGCD
ncbi:MAG: hypothetical protein JJ863_13415 [Deltaproteobacteria bacterium]|nr:hypothetical protein [Deltaproteobacteria bacterium]